MCNVNIIAWQKILMDASTADVVIVVYFFTFSLYMHIYACDMCEKILTYYFVYLFRCNKYSSAILMHAAVLPNNIKREISYI